jgi:L-threonylcarbamoyladenylate synthase
VYGLAANALNPEAVLKIFEIKKRPHFDPLIVHIYDISEISKYAKYIPDDVYMLAEKFSPGPITFVVRKKNIIHDLVTAGMNTVAIRIPSHKLFLNVLKKLPFPLAAPSANMFGRISPTSAGEVYKELKNKINYILDGGKSRIGIESTVIAFDKNIPVILRPGFITKDKIEQILKKEVKYLSQILNKALLSPGTLKMHYSPITPLYIASEDFNTILLKKYNAGILDMSEYKSVNSLASNLFSDLRKLDEKKYDFIIAKKTLNTGIGYAVNDRLEKASYGKIFFENNKLIFSKK